jgi:ketosteroid isomerase-like protein
MNERDTDMATTPSPRTTAAARARAAVAPLAAAGLLATLVAAVPAAPAAAAEHHVCAEAYAAVDAIHGTPSPAACTFIAAQERFGTMPTSPERVDAYGRLFAEDATLWEPGPPGRLIRGREAITAAISGTLALVPDFAFHGERVAVEGDAVMFEADNTFTLGNGADVRYPAVYRVQVDDDGEVVQGRRYYDRATWFTSVAPELPAPFADVADRGAPERGAVRAPDRDALAERGRAWNGEDVRALLAASRGAPLTGPGIDGELRTEHGKRAYLRALFAEVEDVDLDLGQVIEVDGATYAEWHGTVTAEGEQSTFGIIERLGDTGGRRPELDTWTLTFDTLPLVADQETTRDLYARISGL